MLESGDLSQPIAGVYEELITQRMQAQMEQLDSAGWKAIDADVSEESSPHVLARHIGQAIGRKLSQLPHGKRVALANQIIESLASDPSELDTSDAVELIADGPRQLLALAEQEAPGVYAIRPLTPLSETALITNSPRTPASAANCAPSWPRQTRSICSAHS